MKILTGLLAPKSGTATVAEISVSRNTSELKKLIGVLPETLALFDALSIEEHLNGWRYWSGSARQPTLVPSRGRDLCGVPVILWQDLGQTPVLTHTPAGFAAATLPIAAGTISTDTESLEAGDLTIRSGDFDMPAYQARPKKDGKFPLVLVVQEIFGVHEYIKDVCRRLAKQGYFAIAPELYARQGDVSKINDIQQIVQRVVSKVPDTQVLLDLDAAVAYAAHTGKADAERLGITGFCWGGRIVWLYSAHQPKLKAGAAWYGRLVAGPHANSLTPRQPIDVARELHGAILGLYGGKDQGIPLSTVEQMRNALRAAGKDRDCQIIVYSEAGHAFHSDYRPSYHEPSAKDAWAKMLDWFRRYGIA